MNPLWYILFSILIVGKKLAKVVIKPTNEISFRSNWVDNFNRGFFKIIFIAYKNGNVPASTTAICPKITKPSSIDAIPGITTMPVKYCSEDSARPKVETNINNHPIAFMTKIADFWKRVKEKMIMTDTSEIGAKFDKSI